MTHEAGGPKPVAILDFSKPSEDDSKFASYGVTYFDGGQTRTTSRRNISRAAALPGIA